MFKLFDQISFYKIQKIQKREAFGLLKMNMQRDRLIQFQKQLYKREKIVYEKENLLIS